MSWVFKVFFRLFIFGITFFAIAVAIFAAYFAHQFEKMGTHQETVEFTIPRGVNVGNVAHNLYDAGVFGSDFSAKIFVFAARFNGKADKIKAGEYAIPPRASMKDMLSLFESGKVIQRQITIREGLTNWEIKRLLDTHDDLEKNSADLEMKPEGSYLPETYSYQKGDDVIGFLGHMHVSMNTVLDEAWEKRSSDLPIKTKKEALILASIIEKETAVASERRKVAGVFINRLRKDMLLQTDPTVIYAMNQGRHENAGRGPLGRRLLKKDLSYDSPYNTYLYAGLPPAPICNPGRASIEAALNPETHDYLYFVADGTGGHAFAKNLAGHNRNVAQWRKIRNKK